MRQNLTVVLNVGSLVF